MTKLNATYRGMLALLQLYLKVNLAPVDAHFIAEASNLLNPQICSTALIPVRSLRGGEQLFIFC